MINSGNSKRIHACRANRWVGPIVCLILLSGVPDRLNAQSVCLPAPRLLTTTPLGGQVGTSFEVSVTGQHIEQTEQLWFSHPGLTAVALRDAAGLPVPNRFVVTIADDCPVGIHEARLMTRLGISSSRVFSVNRYPEVQRSKANTTLETAMPLPLDTVCNASTTRQAVDYYRFEARKGARIVIDCAAQGIDSKLKAVIFVADQDGNDLIAERRGGVIDFTVPEDGSYVVKVHDLIFNGGDQYFYRLLLKTAAVDTDVARMPSTRSVSSFSWPVVGLAAAAAEHEREPNNRNEEAQPISLPCDIGGSFFPAADVDRYEFTAKKGDVWWVEVASERLGHPTDPNLVVQHVKQDGDVETVSDVVELTDIPSPVKVSSNGYSYDGPPYHAGSADILGKIEIKQDGVHRIQLSDLLGGTRNDPRNTYRLVIRKASPDFAVVGWALHMGLRNGDRNALSKPIALRGGSTIAFEVVAIRRDGFNGRIDLELDHLPAGVTATGLGIPAGQSRGIVLITADADAPRGLSNARFRARATVSDQEVIREGQFASLAWPVQNAWSEIPSPRLLAAIPVSVGGSELAPITIEAAEEKVWEIAEGSSFKLPLKLTRRSDFSGPRITLKAFAEGFAGLSAFDVSLQEEQAEAVIDLARTKTAPGEYVLAFYGTAVARYRYHPELVAEVELALNVAQQNAALAADKVKAVSEALSQADPEARKSLQEEADQAAQALRAAEAAVAAETSRLKSAKSSAQPKDIADIVVSRPIRIRVIKANKS